MKINELTGEMIGKVEFIIGCECYNPNSFDGYTMEEGRDFRYPVTVPKYDENNNVTEYKVRGELLKEINYRFGNYGTDDLKNAKYKFGSNHLYICLGIQKALSFLEERYDLDFEVMEKKLKEAIPNE
jgi:hypothetical protein